MKPRSELSWVFKRSTFTNDPMTGGARWPVRSQTRRRAARRSTHSSRAAIAARGPSTAAATARWILRTRCKLGATAAAARRRMADVQRRLERSDPQRQLLQPERRPTWNNGNHWNNGWNKAGAVGIMVGTATGRRPRLEQRRRPAWGGGGPGWNGGGPGWRQRSRSQVGAAARRPERPAQRRLEPTAARPIRRRWRPWRQQMATATATISKISSSIANSRRPTSRRCSRFTLPPHVLPPITSPACSRKSTTDRHS